MNFILGLTGGIILFLYGIIPMLQPSHFGRPGSNIMTIIRKDKQIVVISLEWIFGNLPWFIDRFPK